ncbi:MAG: NADP-dependent malic enzyme [Promethearchaeati archaeon SRVP18_Atabeyarchaeia-1]
MTEPKGAAMKDKKGGDVAIQWHGFYRGKVGTQIKVPITSLNDFSYWYTPYVADVCRAIQADDHRQYELTNKSNLVAVVTDGTRILGLGDIGPKAGMPVMEGKALIFKYLGDVDAFPICLGTKDADHIVQAVKWIAPTFGGINLEDIDSPKCFKVLKELTRQLDIFVWHDDQQGTATVILAGLINALKVAGKKIGEIQTTVIGAGAAGIPTARLLIEAGARREDVIMVDSKGILYDGRPDMDDWKAGIARITNGDRKTGEIEEALEGSDVVIAISKPGPGVVTKEMVKSMASNSIVFALANPTPEILPTDAKEAGAKVVATGRSDFPNQVNNSLGFPAILRGALDVHAKAINTEMMIEAATEVAKFAEEKGISEDYIVPRMTELEMYPREAAAIVRAAIRTGAARVKVDPKQVQEDMLKRIMANKKINELLMKEGFIKPFPR